MEFLESLQSKFQKYHKKNNIVDNRKSRIESYRMTRKDLRSRNMDERRNLDHIITPIVINSPKKPVDRMALLKAWKNEKDKKKQEQKAARKPTFKIGAVKDIGFPKLKHEFAPANYVFKGPKVVKSINTKSKKVSSYSIQRITRSQKPIASPPLPLPSNTRKKRTADTKVKRLTRQNAIDQTSFIDKEKILRKSTEKLRNSENFLRKRLYKSSESESQQSQEENLVDKVFESETIEKFNHKRKSMKNRFQIDEKKESKSSEDEETKTRKKKSMRKSLYAIENEEYQMVREENLLSHEEIFNTVKNSMGISAQALQNKENELGVERSSKKVRKSRRKSFCVKKNEENELLPDEIILKGRKSVRRSRRIEEIKVNTYEEVCEKSVTPLNVKNSLRKRQSKKIEGHNEVNSEKNLEKIEINYRKTPGNRKSVRKSLTKTPPNNSVFNITPENQSAYVSPFVTTSRGKGSVRKENLERTLRGLPSYSEHSTVDDLINTTHQSSGAAYFLKILNQEIARFDDLCFTWIEYKESNNINDDAKDLIDVAVGQAKLLISKKFQQFEGLIKACLTGIGTEKPVTCEDLQGFWDMMYIQVENLNTRFNRLTEMKNNNWEEIVQTTKTKIVKKRTQSKSSKSVASSGLLAAIQAGRKKNQELKSPKQKGDISSEDIIVKAPFKHSSAKNTPRSILKGRQKKSVSNLNKSVLFKDNEEEGNGKTEMVLNTSFVKTPSKRDKTPKITKK